MSNQPDTPITPYQAANLAIVLKFVPDTGDWHGELRLKCEAILAETPYLPNVSENVYREMLRKRHDLLSRPWKEGLRVDLDGEDDTTPSSGSHE